MSDVTAERYMQEPVRYPGLEVIDLAAEARAVTEPYRNQVMNRVNGACLRLAVFEGPYRWVSSIAANGHAGKAWPGPRPKQDAKDGR